MSRAPAEKHRHIPVRGIVDRVVLGGSDGTIESLATTAALNGAGVVFRTLLVAGLALSLGGAASMLFSNYLSKRSEQESLRIDVERERMEIETEPEEEKRELADLLAKEGYGPGEVAAIIERVTKDKETWLRAQLRHELNINLDDTSPNTVKTSLAAGGAFLLFALIPLVPYLFEASRLGVLLLSSSLGLLALFLLGSTRLISLANFNPLRGLESAGVGAAAVVLLFAIGKVLSVFH